MPDEQWDRLIHGLRTGEQSAARDFYARYGGLMHSLAEKHLAPRLRPRVGPEDVVQSACRTFLRRAKGGQFTLADGEDLWRLLCTITLTKVREQARFHLRQRRGMNREVSLSPSDAGEGGRDDMTPQDHAPPPDEVAAFDDQFGQLMACLNDEERQLLQLKLDDHTNDEAAAQLGCSERTVRRLLRQIRSRLAEHFPRE